MVKKILVVDDDELVLIALRELLTPCGYAVATASNGFDALEQVTKENFDLLILDIIMPGMDGFELCQTIRGLKPYNTVPIVILTAKSNTVDQEKGMEAGANLFLPKPIAPKRLLELIEKSLK